ncbi:AbrB/MazE/SpoVT family DNA-binding domain-containing protein [Anoxybacillus sp. KU2-6(11)]|uniref:AbrB/MazE/SpoVT family DNA-binding domain-containing protein n=1 Tax=Anoxybacillus sp. KU2-6(11) TaxID=1535751 RepID=UPI000AEEEDB2|nr:AbrB/MazE/SpoVT family DNA-binding domain-containing protein [Anoxybacillus sp. KU2-6(11)]
MLGAEPGDQVVFVYGENREVTLKVRKKDSLLSLFGSMPPKREQKDMNWEDIRKEAREQWLASKQKKEDERCTF